MMKSAGKTEYFAEFFSYSENRFSFIRLEIALDLCECCAQCIMVYVSVCLCFRV